MTKIQVSIIRAAALLCIASSAISPARANSAFQTHYDIGTSFLVNQNYELAIKEFNAALKLSPKSAQTLVDRGTAYNGLKKYELALKDFNDAIKFAPDNYLAYNNRGVTYFRTGALAQAIEDFDKAIKKDPSAAFPYLNRAGAALCTGQGAVSAEKIENWLKLVNWKGDLCGHAAILGALGYRQGGKTEAAKKLVEQALSRTDHLKWPYPALKFLAGKMNAKELMEEAERSDYDSTQAHCFIALTHILKKEKRQAQIHLDWVVKTGTPNSVEYWIARGLNRTPDALSTTSPGATPQAKPLSPRTETKTRTK